MYRRRFLSGLTTTALAPLLALSHSVASSADDTLADEAEFAHGCVFARKESARSVPSKTPLIDFWTFRLSEIDPAHLPAHVSPIVVWDEVFAPRQTKQTLQRIVFAISRFYEFEPRMPPNAVAFYLDEKTAMGPTISSLLSNGASTSTRSRIALIDLQSCGLSRLGWRQIIPHLKVHYDLVVGFTHHPGRGPNDWTGQFDDEIGNSDSSWAMRHCAYRFETSDTLLGYNDMLECEQRHIPLNALLHSLADALSSLDFRQAIASTGSGRSFAIAHIPAPSSREVERQRQTVRQEFGETPRDTPITFDARVHNASKTLGAWPFIAPA